MTAAGAANGYGEVALSFALVARQQRLEQQAEAFEERGEIRVRLDEGADRRVAPGERAQCGNVMGVAQEAHIEDEVRVAWQAMTVGERRDEDRDAGRRAEGEMALQQPFQVTRIERCGIDNQIG